MNAWLAYIIEYQTLVCFVHVDTFEIFFFYFFFSFFYSFLYICCSFRFLENKPFQLFLYIHFFFIYFFCCFIHLHTGGLYTDSLADERWNCKISENKNEIRDQRQMGKVFSSSYYSKQAAVATKKNEKKFKFKPWHLFALHLLKSTFLPFSFKIYLHLECQWG